MIFHLLFWESTCGSDMCTCICIFMNKYQPLNLLALLLLSLLSVMNGLVRVFDHILSHVACKCIYTISEIQIHFCLCLRYDCHFMCSVQSNLNLWAEWLTKWYMYVRCVQIINILLLILCAKINLKQNTGNHEKRKRKTKLVWELYYNFVVLTNAAFYRCYCSLFIFVFVCSSALDSLYGEHFGAIKKCFTNWELNKKTKKQKKKAWIWYTQESERIDYIGINIKNEKYKAACNTIHTYLNTLCSHYHKYLIKMLNVNEIFFFFL